MPEFTLQKIQHEITQRGLGWQAGMTSLATLPPEAQALRLGLQVKPAHMERLRQSFQAVVVSGPGDHPSAHNWRDVDGGDWTTPIRDQGNCGACVAFGILGAVETMAKWAGGDPGVDPNLSEAHLFFCGCGSCCDTGTWPEELLDYLADHGVPDEACFPYRDRNMPCRNTCADWEERAVRISAWQEILDVETRKQWLSSIGPVVGAMAVYRDFFFYTGGVYHPSGAEAAMGYHAVTVVGYDEAQSAWLCKNSWGTGWGEAGWFRLAYGTCGLDTEFPAWAVESVDLPAATAPRSEAEAQSPLGRLLGALRGRGAED
jgi:C1A family cysteine protease